MSGPSTTIDDDLVEDFNKCRVVSLLLGVFPLTLANNRMVVTFWGLFCSFLMVTVQVASFLLQAFLIHQKKMQATDTSKNVVFAVISGMLRFSVTLSLINVIRRKRLLLEIIQEVSELKIFLEVSGISWKPKRRVLFTVLLPVLFIVANILDTIFYHMKLRHAAKTFSLCSLFTVVMWVFSNFLWFTDTLAECFRGLAFCIKPSCSGHHLQRLMKLHHLLSATSNTLNHIDSLGFTVGYLASFFFSLYHAYVFLEHLLTKYHFLRISAYLISALIPLTFCFTIVGSCERVKRQVCIYLNLYFLISCYLIFVIHSADNTISLVYSKFAVIFNKLCYDIIAFIIISDLCSEQYINVNPLTRTTKWYVSHQMM